MTHYNIANEDYILLRWQWSRQMSDISISEVLLDDNRSLKKEKLVGLEH